MKHRVLDIGLAAGPHLVEFLKKSGEKFEFYEVFENFVEKSK